LVLAAHGRVCLTERMEIPERGKSSADQRPRASLRALAGVPPDCSRYLSTCYPDIGPPNIRAELPENPAKP